MSHHTKRIDRKTQWVGVYRGRTLQVFSRGETPQLERRDGTLTIRPIGAGAYRFETQVGRGFAIGLAFKWPDGRHTLELVDVNDASRTVLTASHRHGRLVVRLTSESSEAGPVRPANNVFYAFGRFQRAASLI